MERDGRHAAHHDLGHRLVARGEHQVTNLDDEVAETLLLDEAAELRAIRRAELTLDTDAESIRGDEFVCQSCFLVKRTSQLANKRKLICKDCAG